MNLTVNFTDTGNQGHTYSIAWDDPPTGPSSGSFTGSATSGSVTVPHTFASTLAGVYGVTVTVTDDCGLSATSTYYIVIYDPSAGFVTGGGWIMVAPGSYPTNAALTGKANFGFVSKYKSGQSKPSGETEFQFHVASFNFKSTGYDWLVVSGPKAQYKGSGTINGAGDYGFLLTATDGQVNGGGNVDKFRIKIWNKTTSVVVFDNVLGSSDDIDTASPQQIGGGSIVIHK